MLIYDGQSYSRKSKDNGGSNVIEQSGIQYLEVAMKEDDIAIKDVVREIKAHGSIRGTMAR